MAAVEQAVDLRDPSMMRSIVLRDSCSWYSTLCAAATTEAAIHEKEFVAVFVEGLADCVWHATALSLATSRTLISAPILQDREDCEHRPLRDSSCSRDGVRRVFRYGGVKKQERTES